MYALLDSRATCSAIASDIIDKIEGDIRQLPLTLRTFGAKSTSYREVSSFTVSDLNENITIPIENALVSDLLSTDNETPPRNDLTSKYPHLIDVTLDELEDPLIGIILDAKHSWAWLAQEARVGEPHQPIGILSQLGWYLIGGNPDYDDQLNKSDANLYIIDTSEPTLLETIQRMYKHDFIGRLGEDFSPEYSHRSQYDEYAESQLEESILFDEEERRYQIALPWKYGRETTAHIFKNTNFLASARNRLHKLRQKFQKNPELMKGSFAQIRDSIDKGHVRILDKIDVTDPSRPVCYLANHIVTYPDKPGKFRVCQDDWYR